MWTKQILPPEIGDNDPAHNHRAKERRKNPLAKWRRRFPVVSHKGLFLHGLFSLCKVEIGLIAVQCGGKRQFVDAH